MSRSGLAACRALALGLAIAALSAVASAATDPRLGPYNDGLEAFKRQDFDSAYLIWKPLAEDGYGVAQYSLGKLFDQGGGVIRANAFLAALWYRKAADQGVAAAQNNLAILYAKGRGVPEDPGRAVSLWRQAADNGHAMAKFNVGLSYFNGNGVDKDAEQAARWFQAAATAGISEAQYVLGQLYRQGLVFDKDLDQAMVWYGMAARQDHQAAKAQVERLILAMGQGEPGQELQAGKLGGEKDSDEQTADLPQLGGEEDPVDAARPDQTPVVSTDLPFPAQKTAPAATVPNTLAVSVAEKLESDRAAQSVRPADVMKAAEAALGANKLDPAPQDESNLAQASQATGDRPKSQESPQQRPAADASSTQRRFSVLGSQSQTASVDPPSAAKTNETPAIKEPRPRVSALASLPGTGEGGWRIWLASGKNQTEAEAFLREAIDSFPDIHQNHTVLVEKAELGDLGSFYRVMTGAIEQASDAKGVCERIWQDQPDAFCQIRSFE